MTEQERYDAQLMGNPEFRLCEAKVKSSNALSIHY